MDQGNGAHSTTRAPIEEVPIFSAMEKRGFEIWYGCKYGVLGELNGRKILVPE